MPTREKQLDADTRSQLGRDLAEQMNDARQSAQELLAKVRGYRDQYEGVLPVKKDAWSSNVNIAETKATVKTAVANLSEAIFAVDPLFDVESESPEYDDLTEETRNWCEFWHDRTRLRSKGAMAISEALITGQCWLKPGIKSTGKESPDVIVLAPNQPLAVKDLDLHPTCDYVRTEDMCLLPYTADSFEQANGAFARRWVRWNDIQKAGKANVFYPDAVERVKAQWQGDREVSQTHAQQGITDSSPKSINQASFECWEGIYRWRETEDADERDWLVLLYHQDDSSEAIVLKCVPYEPIYGSQWYFVPIICDPKPKSMWGGSMCEDIRGLQNWLNAVFNQATDAVLMAIRPPIAAPLGSEVHRRKPKWGPNEIWPVQNTDVGLLGVPQSVFAGLTAAMSQTNFVLQVKERVTGVASVMQGAKEQGNRTKYEVQAVVESGNQLVKHQVSTLQIGMDDTQGFEAYASCFMNILKAFMPRQPIRYQSRKGSEKWAIATPNMHDGDYRFVPHGSTSLSNPEIRFARAKANRELLAQSPFCRISPLDTPETVLDKVRRWYRGESEYAQAMGNKRPELWLGGEPQNAREAMVIAYSLDPQATTAVMQRAMQQGQQAQAAAQGGTGQPQFANGEMVPGQAAQVAGGPIAGAGAPPIGGIQGPAPPQSGEIPQPAPIG